MAFHLVPLGVEQIGDAVQRHRGLTGARASLDHEHPGMVEPDDPVLLGLDRRHDVAHPVAARCVDRREQRCVLALRTSRAAEDLVGEIEHLTPKGVELAATTHVLRVRGGGDVERARRRRPPIEQQRFVLVVFVEQSDPADVRRFARNGVQPTETQPVIRHVQPPQLSGHSTHLGIPIHECPAVLEVDGGPQRRAISPLRSRAFGVEPCVEVPRRSSVPTAIRLHALGLAQPLTFSA